MRRRSPSQGLAWGERFEADAALGQRREEEERRAEPERLRPAAVGEDDGDRDDQGTSACLQRHIGRTLHSQLPSRQLPALGADVQLLHERVRRKFGELVAFAREGRLSLHACVGVLLAGQLGRWRIGAEGHVVEERVDVWSGRRLWFTTGEEDAAHSQRLAGSPEENQARADVLLLWGH
eukprot:765020-Hanusia_phi.AAC.5